MEYLICTLGLIARRDRRHLTVTAPDELERNDNLCRYVTIDEKIHTDIGKGMADAVVAYRYSAGVRRIENLKNSGKLILVQDEDIILNTCGYDREYMKNIYAHSASAQKNEIYLQHLLYLKSDAVIVKKRSSAGELLEFCAEEEVLRLLGLR